ncbi:hypothetical protein CROQUDRAFT_109794 [Cronartium quercuum f. sp. fusiforme G11]|uniref:Prenyltransferase alpha-alpha toroid domain-containing protein n=1 Tax=Cronartium quercuum f. sp. fusiforme G11 TaxID=708437 RepID=A0A9P6T7Y5_9BASI|nr:hypothetical protein CROQUDRAFT_109794 [Cronartium quercuum f. sp. fusiforme G11]
MTNSPTTTGDSDRTPFATKAHIRYALRCLRMLPSAYEADDSNRLTFGFFAVGALSMLDGMDRIDQKEKQDYRDWINHRWNPRKGGFSGQPSVDLRAYSDSTESLDQPHITHTYAALLLLGLLSVPQADDPSPANPYIGLDLPKLLEFIAGCQRSNGSFCPFPSSTEQDVRFVYCAAAILATVNVKPERVIDVQATVNFLAACRRYDGGYGQAPHLESQGGTTYCALAALSLLGRLEDSLSADDALETVKWLVDRQTAHDDLTAEDSDDELDAALGGPESKLIDVESKSCVRDQLLEGGTPLPEPLVAGFQGRPGKPLDACYSFWCTAALSIIQKHSVFSRISSSKVTSKASAFSHSALYHDPLANIRFLLHCQSKQWGGIARFPNDLPDLYHNYLALGSISLSYALRSNFAHGQSETLKGCGQNPLAEHDPSLNIPFSTVKWIKQCFSPEGHQQIQPQKKIEHLS